ncbi:hypothetical protein GCM10008955_17460 [Deinococcus malanensis]|uniref:Uncharacterized protein n=1 Tax=Deinococcus malanensis TaxID=1706855 RepID=A0ABQ2EWK6_9DEIO|nr:hypothetical protein [Deinococcus malanensis]GGK24386.1 hypothetical protein GCM10008955_17460 [Deinococcus malanensis]
MTPPPWPQAIQALRAAVYLDRAITLADAHLRFAVPLDPSPEDQALLAEHHLRLTTVEVGESARSQPQTVTFVVSMLDRKEPIHRLPAFQLRQLAMLAVARHRMGAQLGAWRVTAHLYTPHDEHHRFKRGDLVDAVAHPPGAYRTLVEADSAKYTEKQIARKAQKYAEDPAPQLWLAPTPERQETLECWLGRAIPDHDVTVWHVQWNPVIPPVTATSTMAPQLSGQPVTPPLADELNDPHEARRAAVNSRIAAWQQAGVTEISNAMLMEVLGVSRASAVNYRRAWVTARRAEGLLNEEGESMSPADVTVLAEVHWALGWYEERSSREGLLRAYLRGEFADKAPGTTLTDPVASVAEAPAERICPALGMVRGEPPVQAPPDVESVGVVEESTPPAWMTMGAVTLLCLIALGVGAVALPPLKVLRAGPAAIGQYVRQDAKTFFARPVIAGWTLLLPAAHR